VLGYTIAAEIGDITRFASPTKLAGYTGLCPRVYQSGGKDDRGPLAKERPKYLRWALIEAAVDGRVAHGVGEDAKHSLGRGSEDGARPATSRSPCRSDRGGGWNS
jgi:transposase